MSEGIPPAQSGSGPIAPISTLNLTTDEALDSAPVLGSVIAEKYRVEELIARGGMGAVYLATHLVSGKRLALKWMLPSLTRVPGAKERFVREACATARIEHPNVVDIYDVGNDRGSVYLVMELLRGETLAHYLQRAPKVAAAEAVALLMPALRGVAAAHAQQVIHRDLKPENIFLCRSVDGEAREPKVLDFGISKIMAAGDGHDLSLTRSGAVMGTPYYMSPEQVRGAKEVDERGDVYAFGVILYEMLTGQRPFDAETYNQLILKIATEDPAPIPKLNEDVDPRLVAVVERAMARDPRVRYQNIESLAQALEPFARGGVQFRASTVRLQGDTGSGDSFESAKTARWRHKLVRKRFVAAGIALGCISTALWFWVLAEDGGKAATLPRPAAATTKTAVLAPSPLVPMLLDTETTESAASAAPVTRTRTGTGQAEGQAAAEALRGETATATPQPPGVSPMAEPGANAGGTQPRALREARKLSNPAVSAREREAESERAPRETASSDAPAQQSPRGRSKLPDDWDDRLSIPSRRAPHPSAAAAGPLDARDLD